MPKQYERKNVCKLSIISRDKLGGMVTVLMSRAEG